MPRGRVPSLAGWGVLGTLTLGVFLHSSSQAADDPAARTPVAFNSPRESAPVGALRNARLLLRAGQPALALKEVRESLESAPADARLLCLEGDILFRQAEFEAAERAYRSALASDATSARAHLGLGRIRAAEFLRAQARGEFSSAYQLDPYDPDVLLAYADVLPERNSRKYLLRRFLSIAAAHEDPARLGDVSARLEMEERLGDRETLKLASPYQSYRFKLANFFPVSGAPNGLLISTRINGGKPLRLVLDTGGSGIVINHGALRGREIEALANSRIGGLGSDQPRDAMIALASSVAIDDFRLENVIVQVVTRNVVPGADGIIGSDVFQRFRLRLDPRARVLDLAPFEGDGSRGETPGASVTGETSDPWTAHDRQAGFGEGYVPAYRVSHFLLIRAALDGHERFFMLDTGSAHSVVADSIASDPRGRGAGLHGAQGEIPGYHLPPLTFQLGGGAWRDPDPVAVDLQQLSHQQGVEISGAIGYSLLRRAVLTIDYRDGLIQLSSR